MRKSRDEAITGLNVKVGDYFVVVGNNTDHYYSVGTLIRCVDRSNISGFGARAGRGARKYIRCVDVRRATDEDMLEDTDTKGNDFYIGDVVKLDGDGGFAIVTDRVGQYEVRPLDGGCYLYLDGTEMRYATEDEKIHLEVLIGRYKYEYKPRDLVELLNGSGTDYYGLEGYIFEVVSFTSMGAYIKNNTGTFDPEGDTWVSSGNLKLIAPVEWRYDVV